jgi:hypothetical protein
MLTWGDDYPIHQTPEPVAFAGSDRNFYDRYFFNGYASDGALFFAAALGVYPALDVIDAAFCLVIDGVQHNVRASRRLHSERMNLAVGPIQVQVVAPLQKLRLQVSDNQSGVTADISFEGRHAPIEEPRFTRRQGPRMFMDYTRLTQNGAWSGLITHNKLEIRLDPSSVRGTRDRSWGIRPVGAPDAQPAAGAFQFFWLWSPFNFGDRAVFFHTNDDETGAAWNRRAVMEVFGASRTEYEHPTTKLVYKSGTRRLQSAEVALSPGGPVLKIAPTGANFYMNGLGYTHPTWGHGRDHGELEIAADTLADVDDALPGNLHIQALARATLSDHGANFDGFGVLEQFIMGPHAPSGFRSVLDTAP